MLENTNVEQTFEGPERGTTLSTLRLSVLLKSRSSRTATQTSCTHLWSDLTMRVTDWVSPARLGEANRDLPLHGGGNLLSSMTAMMSLLREYYVIPWKFRLYSAMTSWLYFLVSPSTTTSPTLSHLPSLSTWTVSTVLICFSFFRTMKEQISSRWQYTSVYTCFCISDCCLFFSWRSWQLHFSGVTIFEITGM